MANKKNAVVTLKECLDVMNNDFNDTEVVEWRGKMIEIKKVISFNDMVEFFDYVLMNVFSDNDATYRAGILDFAIRMATIESYTNIQMNMSVDEMYKLVYLTDIYDFVRGKICENQLDSIIKSINSEIGIRIGRANASAAKDVNELMNAMKTYVDGFSKVFSGITSEDIATISNAAASSGNFEEMLLKAYAKSKTGDED